VSIATGNKTLGLSPLERRLLNDFQHGLPLVPRPYAAMARRLGVSETEVIATLRRLAERGAVSRVGPVFRPNRAGVSTLAAMAVAPEDLERIAAIVSGFAEVNHNYEREHEYNLWFVVTAPDAAALREVLARIEAATGHALLELPLLEDFHIDLGFELEWT